MPRITRPDWSPKYCRHRDQARVKIPGRGWLWLPGKFDSAQSRQAYDQAVGEWILAGRPRDERGWADSGRAASPGVPAVPEQDGPALAPADVGRVLPAIIGDGRNLAVWKLCVVYMRHMLEHYASDDDGPAPQTLPADAGEFERAVVARAMRDRSPIAVAAAKVRKESPALFADYNARGSPFIPRKVKRSGVVWRCQRACRFLCDVHGDTPVSAFGPRALEQVRDRMVESGLARSTVNQWTATIRSVFKWGVAKELVPVAVWQSLTSLAGLRAGRTAARETEPVTPVSDELVLRTIPLLTPVVAAMVRVQRLTGARPAEVCRMRADEIDRSGPVWVYRPRRHKTAHRGKGRSIVLGPKAQEVLRPFIDRGGFLFRPVDAIAYTQEQERRKWGKGGAGESPPVAADGSGPRRLGQCYTSGSYRGAIRRACLKGGLEIWAPNQLRHTRATELRRDHDLDAAAAVLGHSRVETTQVYAERSEQRAMEIALSEG